MNTNEKATDIFEFYYRVIPFTHTNKQRAEVALKCSLKLIREIIEGYEFDLIQQMQTNGNEGDIMLKINFWDEVETIIINKVK